MRFYAEKSAQDRLGLQESFQAECPVLAADTRLFETAKRCKWFVDQGIDQDSAGVYVAGQPAGAF